MSSKPTNSKRLDLDAWLTAFAARLGELGNQKMLAHDWWTTRKALPYSWMHARIWGALVQTAAAGYVPMVDGRWNGGFKPDLMLCTSGEQTAAIIEYESPNSSDERLMLKDLRHFQSAILEYVDRGVKQYAAHKGWEEQLPGDWIVISSFPHEPVDWPWWGYNDQVGAGPPEKDVDSRDADPFRYYEASIRADLDRRWAEIRSRFGGDPPDCSIVWLNLGPTALEVAAVKGARHAMEGKRYEFSLPQSVW